MRRSPRSGSGPLRDDAAQARIRRARARAGLVGATPGSAKRARAMEPALGHNAFEPVVLTGRLEDLALRDPRFADSRAEIVSLGRPSHYRATFRPGLGAGFLEMCGIADGFYAMISDIRYDQPCPVATAAADFMHIRIASSLDSESDGGSQQPFHLRGPGVTIGFNPADAPISKGFLSGHNHAVHIYVHRDALGRLYPADESDLPGVVRDFTAGTLETKFLRCLTLGPAFLRCLEDLHECPLGGGARRMFIQAKAIEVVSHAFDALATDEGASDDEASAITTRSVLRAQQLLAENFVAPPSLERLAQQVGLSRTALCVGFRQVVGQTVFDHIADLRMQQALALLTGGKSSIAEIAHAVGFHHTSSFSVAVQRRFGVTPSELRRRGTPAD